MADRGAIAGITTLADEASWLDALVLSEAIAALKPGNAILKLGLSDAEERDLGDRISVILHGPAK